MPRKKEEESIVEAVEEKVEKIVETKQEIPAEFPEMEIGIDIFADHPKEEKKIEEEIKKGKKDEKTLIPLDDYVKAGVYIGTKVITPNMRKYVYRRRNDGIAIINTNIVDKKLKEASEFMSKYEPKDTIVVCKREAGWRAVNLFSKLTGIRVFTKKYPAGILTNTALPNFFETDMIMVCDPWLDKNALKDAKITKKKVLGLCDTNNLDAGIDLVVPINNKSNKSLGVAFYILAREYMKARGIKEKLPEMEEFIGEKLESLPERKVKEKDSDMEKARAKIESIRELNKEEE